MGYANVDRKHLKRHTRPYGCTFTKCLRRFGSKNDWKRHENTMHYQVEAWKCAEPKISDGCNSTTIDGKYPATATAKQCGRLCYRRESFMTHLFEEHGLGAPEKEDYVKEQSKKRRVGRNGQCGFWCGFCQTVVRLEKQGIEAWDERFNHIDDEHFKKGNRVEDWLPLEGEVPRGVLEMTEMCDPEKEAREAEDKGSDEEDSGPDAEGEGDDVVRLEVGGLEEKTARAKAAAMARTRHPSNVTGPETRERVRRLWDCVSILPSVVYSLFSPAQPTSIPAPVLGNANPSMHACLRPAQCKCGNGELSRDTDLMCHTLECNHPRCERCITGYRREAKVP